MNWSTTHTADCEVTHARADLLRLLKDDPKNPYLLGAVPEYDNGGDQEAELCDCGVYDAAHYDAPSGNQAVRFTIPAAFEDGGGLIIEMRAFAQGPRGGRGEQLRLPRTYWRGLLPKLVQKGVEDA